MVFGEIVEPTTRALIFDDELEDLPNYKGPEFKWEGNAQPPDDMNTLVFAESKKILQICSSINKDIQPVARIKYEGVSIYKLGKIYLITFDGNNKKLVVGEIVELLSPWIKKAQSINSITSALISSFQPVENLPDGSPVTFTRCLTNLDEVPFNFCERLEAPNLIKDLGAAVLTYCIHCNLKSTLWIVYTDHMPLDSMNSSEIIKLLEKLDFKVKVDFKSNSLENNLYL